VRGAEEGRQQEDRRPLASTPVLGSILERKRREVVERRAALPETELARRAHAATPTRGFAKALSRTGERLRIIAEVKRASPSAGAIRTDLDPVVLAATYARAGAAAISVLTDGPGFGGSLEDLRRVRATATVPLLRKDFVVDVYQLLEAREAGADAALLIVAALTPTALSELLAAAAELTLDALVEVHTPQELETALRSGATLVGVNNRDLTTFHVDLATSEALLPRIPAGVRAVAESGVRTPKDAHRLRRAGAANLLVGEALVRAADPAALLDQMTDTA
jgi:indole-3-glycerol phosphate synthase